MSFGAVMRQRLNCLLCQDSDLTDTKTGVLVLGLGLDLEAEVIGLGLGNEGQVLGLGLGFGWPRTISRTSKM